jgi:hypothetical protein
MFEQCCHLSQVIMITRIAMQLLVLSVLDMCINCCIGCGLMTCVVLAMIEIDIYCIFTIVDTSKKFGRVPCD